MMTRDEDDLSSAIFEARCIEEVNVNNWQVFFKNKQVFNCLLGLAPAGYKAKLESRSYLTKSN